MNFKSIKWRLQIWYGLSLLIVLMGFGFTAFHLERSRTLRKIDGELQRRADALLTVLRRPPRDGGQFPPHRDGEQFRPPRNEGLGEDGPPDRRPDGPPKELRIPAQISTLFDAGDTNGFYYIFIWRDGRELGRSTNAPQEYKFNDLRPGGAKNIRLSEPNPETPRRPFDDGPEVGETEPNARIPGNQLAHMAVPAMRGSFREILVTTPPGERIIVGRNITPELKEFRLIAARLALVGGGILLVGMAIGWWLSSRALRPIAEISRTAGEIAGGDLSKRINSSETESELGQLAGVLNSTFARLDATFAQQKQFTSDAAHELRTPVAVILTQTQSTLTKERSPAEYCETLEACQRAAQRMRRLIESLLELARFDAGQEGMKRTRFDLANPTRDCIEMLLPLADERKIRIRAQLVPAACHGDPERITQVVVNLLTNAVNHNKAGGEIQIVTRAENGSAMLIISDNGPGISAEHLPHIFDRFYCVDAARNSSQGRSGLGLAISKAIVEAHGGVIEVSSKVGAGTVFTVRLPVM
jgi:two-component system OmpR family sensor kinase